MGSFRPRGMVRKVAWRAWPAALVLGLALAPNAAPADGVVDTNSLHLQGPRSTGGMLLPSSRILAPGAWDLSLTYGHEGGVVRSRIPTGTIRGGARFQEVPWIEERDLMLLQFAVSPLDRLELLAGLPMLLGQQVSSDPSLGPPSSGTTAFGDLRLGLRYGVWESRGWGASLQGGLLIPSGRSDFGMGDTKARADVAGTFGFRSEDGWSAHLHAGHLMGQRHTVGDQIFGDSAYGGLLLQMRHGVGNLDLQWSLEAVTASVLAAAEPGSDPRRSSLEILGGARVFLDSLYFDLGGGLGAVDDGITPAWRLLASVGVHGLWERAPEPAPPQREVVYLPAPQPSVAQEPQPASTAVGQEPQPDPRETFRAMAVEERSIFFEVGTAELDPIARTLLRDIALHLLTNDRGLVITGYADDQGTSERNAALSLRRAETVRDALMEAGVGADRLQVVGAGDKAPVAHSTSFGRSINRRVAFSWSD